MLSARKDGRAISYFGLVWPPLQAFSALDIATQSLIATYLGQNMQQKAFEVLKRTLQVSPSPPALVRLPVIHFPSSTYRHPLELHHQNLVKVY